MNPFMNGMAQGQVPNMPTTKELWKHEKEKYRHWIILFGIGILVIFALFLTSLILSIVNEASIKEHIRVWGYGKAQFAGIDPKGKIIYDGSDYDLAVKDWASSTWTKENIIYTSIKAGLSGIGVILFVSTTYNAYQKKSFARLSAWASFAIAICALIGVYEIISMAWQEYPKVVFQYPEGIFLFILYIIPIAIWLFVSRPIAKIRRTFLMAERIEAFKNSPQYQQMQEQMSQMQNGGNINPAAMGPFGPQSQPQTGPAGTPTAAPTQPVKRELTPKEKRIKELQAMNISNLKEIAKKLSISGYTSMKKAELIDNIVRISESN